MNDSVVHMRDQRNMKKRIVFAILVNCEPGVKKCAYFLEKGSFWILYTKGRLRVIFQTPPNMSSKKACLGVNLGAKMQIFRLGGVFPDEVKFYGMF